MKDMTGKRCRKCKKGRYMETELQDDWHGKLHCNKCNDRIDRWQN